MGCCGSCNCTCKRERNIKLAVYAVIIIAVGSWMWYMSQESVQRKNIPKAPSATPTVAASMPPAAMP